MKRFPIATKIVTLFIVMMVILATPLTPGCDNTSDGVSQDAYDKIKSDLNIVQNQIEDLEDEIDELQDSHDILQIQNQQLEEEKDDIQNDYDTTVDWYDDIREEVNQRHGNWEDKKLFITPDDEEVAAKVQEITGGFSDDNNERWAAYKAMYDWVVDNIEYNTDSRIPYLPSVNGGISWYQDYWRMPSETLSDEAGDCEDMAALLASMRSNYLSDMYAQWVITWQSDDSGHAAAAFPVEGGNLTILDPAGNYYTGYPYYLTQNDVSSEINNWLAKWSDENNIHVATVFSDTLYETFDTTEEFVEWALAE